MNEQPIRTPAGNSYIFSTHNVHHERHVMRTFEEHWICPMPNCGGDMIYLKYIWPAGEHPIYHHRCEKCGHVAGIEKRMYPRTVNEVVREETPPPAPETTP